MLLTAKTVSRGGEQRGKWEDKETPRPVVRSRDLVGTGSRLGCLTCHPAVSIKTIYCGVEMRAPLLGVMYRARDAAQNENGEDNYRIHLAARERGWGWTWPMPRTGDARQHGHPSNPRQEGWVGSAACVNAQLSRTLSPLTSVLRSLTRSEHARGGCLVGSVGRWGGRRARPSPGCLYARGSPHTPGAREGLPQLLISHARFHSPVCAEASR